MTIHAKEAQAEDEQLVIKSPDQITAHELRIKRFSVGIPGDYKPCLAVLPGNELLLVVFHTSDGVPNEYSFLYRSTDSGRSWSKRRPLDIIGREPYLSVTRNGTIFISTHVLTTARGNTEDYVYSNLYRSSDSGRTFTVTKIGHEQVPGARRNGRWPGRALIVTGRNVVELHDGTLSFGAGAPHGAEFLWRSRDDGRNWDKQLACTFGSIDMTAMTYPILREAFFHQAFNGDLLALCRVMLKFFPPLFQEQPFPGRRRTSGNAWCCTGPGTPATWKLEEVGSWYGEGYPSVLALQGGDMLLTFTVRAAVAPRPCRCISCHAMRVHLR